jgi:hypothetical protein
MAADASLGVGVLSVKESNSTPYIIWSNREWHELSIIISKSIEILAKIGLLDLPCLSFLEGRYVAYFRTRLIILRSVDSEAQHIDEPLLLIHTHHIDDLF